MKGFALALLCLVALVQARSIGVQNGQTVAALGDAPWFVHLRLALPNAGGQLKTCAGALIGESWVLTTADCVRGNTFAWLRFGAVDAVQPSLVTENSPSSNIVHPQANLALIDIRRVVHATETIAPVPLATEASDVESATFFAFGEADGVAGRHLASWQLNLQAEGEQLVASSEGGQGTQSDMGAPLVVGGKLIGLLDQPGNGDHAAVFISTHNYIGWIEAQTGLNISS